MLRRSVWPLVLAAGLPACNSDTSNPFDRIFEPIEVTETSDLLFSSNLHGVGESTPEVFEIEKGGQGLGQVTFCGETRLCATIEGVRAPDGIRIAFRRIEDGNGDGVLDEVDGIALVVIDTELGVSSPIVPAPARVSGFDWSPTSDVIVYSGQDVLPVDLEDDDLYRVDSTGRNNSNLTRSAQTRERRPRLSPDGGTAVYERIFTNLDAKGQIWLFQTSTFQAQLTAGGPGEEPLEGTLYVVGSDADPVFSPSGRRVAFRRLTSTGNGGIGTWDILTIAVGATDLQVVVSGPLYRGAPDWSEDGILYVETDMAADTTRIVAVDPDGTNRHVIVTQAANATFQNPRWLIPPTQ
jgi:Tol biopolymer transport system component